MRFLNTLCYDKKICGKKKWTNVTGTVLSVKDSHRKLTFIFGPNHVIVF